MSMYIEDQIESLQGDVDYIRSELADIQQELRFGSLSDLRETVEGLEARVAELGDAFLAISKLAEVLPR